MQEQQDQPYPRYPQPGKYLTLEQRKRLSDRRRELRQITSAVRRELVAEYDAAPADALLTERHIAAALQCSRSNVQAMRLRGTGPAFLRTTTGCVRYRKADVERFKSEYLRPHRCTIEYADEAA